MSGAEESDDDDYDFDWDDTEERHAAPNEGEEVSEEDRKMSTLLDMGFLVEDASSAINRCGANASVTELVDSICAAQMADECDALVGDQSDDNDEELSDSEDDALWESSTSPSSEDEDYQYNPRKERRRSSAQEKRNKRIRKHEEKKQDMTRCKKMKDHNGASPSHVIPKRECRFSLPFEQPRFTHRTLPEEAITSPPFFYFENVALAPKGSWDTMSRFLYDIEPEFVDSKYFCAMARKRGYIHNLPIENRFPLLPLPPRTIHEAFPSTRKWWPSWDTCTHLNCLMTGAGSSKLNEKIRALLVRSGDPAPPLGVQHYVMQQCRKGNLIWIGLHKVAPLEPEEMEMLLGFPRDHTRGVAWRERHVALANSFQIDTVAFHLSVLKEKFPKGINVLSLFSGIGGAEVALHRLGIRLNTIVSVESSENNRNTLRRGWDETRQTGTLVELHDVQRLDGDMLGRLIGTFGGFDLVVGGSPCNNLAGRDRFTRNGLGR